MANDRLIAYVAPSQGGMLYELDVRAARHNLLATIQRRPEAYHAKIREQATTAPRAQSNSTVESIHDRMVCKQANLDQSLIYDQAPRKSFLDHFFDNDIALTAVRDGSAVERGDFATAAYQAKLRRGNGKVQLQLSREGNAWGLPFRITKALTLQSGSPALEVAYLVEGLPQDRQLHLALEWNFAACPPTPTIGTSTTLRGSGWAIWGPAST